MALTQPRIFTFSKGGGSKGNKSMKELVGFADCVLLSFAASPAVCALGVWLTRTTTC
jgi:hypothetical protein